MIKGVLDNFLQTYVIRYSDFNGYWLFGFLVADTARISVDLLDKSAANEDTPTGYAKWLAVHRFEEQVRRNNLPIAWLREARLEIARSNETRSIFVNGRSSPGYGMQFLAHAVTDLGKTYQRTSLIFVATHNPEVESRSTRVA